MSRATDDVGTIVVDLDGVIYHGDQGLPGAGAALQDLADSGWRLVMATNNSSTTPAMVVAKIARLTGFSANVDHVVTSSMAAASYLAGTCDTAMVVGEPALAHAIDAVGIIVVDAWQDAASVVVGIDFTVTYDTLDRAARAIRNGATFVATNTDATFPMPDGLAVGAGAIVAAISTASGAEPVVCGKPELPMRRLIKDHVAGDRVWVIGDRPETDIAMADAEGWRSIMPLTGVTTEEAAAGAIHTPDFIVQSISEAPAVIARHGGA